MQIQDNTYKDGCLTSPHNKVTVTTKRTEALISCAKRKKNNMSITLSA